jgi:tetratricopeptide (TPR) repeat protein
VSTRPENRKFRFSRPSLHTVLLLLALALAAVALWVALRDNMTSDTKTSVDVSDGVTAAEAETILERANDAASFVGNLLNFLEVMFAAISLALVAVAWVLRGMILDQVEELRDFVTRTEKQIAARGEHLDQLEKTLTEELSHIIRQTGENIAEVKKEGRDAFRVLRLQLLAEQQVRAHNIDTAIDTLLTAHKLDPHDHATNYLMGYLYTSRKEIDLAIAYLEDALALEPEFTPGIAALGLALRRKGDSITDPASYAKRDQYWAQAEAKLHEALSKDRKLTDADGESYFGTLGGLYRRQGRYYAALDAYERAHKVTPGSSYPIINLATIHAHQGNPKEAAYYFEQVVKQAVLQLDDDPRDAWTRCDLAQARLVLGDPDEALKELQTVIDQEPERGVLETVYDGLKFLTEAPNPIQGLDSMIALIDAALGAWGEKDQAQEGTPSQDQPL